MTNPDKEKNIGNYRPNFSKDETPSTLRMIENAICERDREIKYLNSRIDELQNGIKEIEMSCYSDIQMIKDQLSDLSSGVSYLEEAITKIGCRYEE